MKIIPLVIVLITGLVKNGHSYCAVWNGGGYPDVKMGLSYDGNAVSGHCAYRFPLSTPGVAGKTVSSAGTSPGIYLGSIAGASVKGGV